MQALWSILDYAGEHQAKRAGTIPLSRIAFKYVVAFVVFVSLVLLSVDSRRQLSQMNESILWDMRHAANAVVQDLDEQYVTPDNLAENVERYHHLLGMNVILLDQRGTVVVSGSPECHPGEFINLESFQVLTSRSGPILLNSESSLQ